MAVAFCRYWRFLVLVLLCIYTSEEGYGDNDAILMDPIVIPPPPASGRNIRIVRGLVLLPGGLVPETSYVPVIQSVQTRIAADIELWAVIATCPFRSCVPFGPLADERVQASLKKLSYESNVTFSSGDIILSGHSLGGSAASAVFSKHLRSPETFGGLALLGTQFENNTGYPLDIGQFPAPFLAVSGDLDMLSVYHMTRIYNQSLLGDVSQKSVVVMPGLDHSSFCPGFNVFNDHPAMIEESRAVQQIGDVLGSWIAANTKQLVGRSHYVDAIHRWVRGPTAEVLSPMIKLLDFERTWCISAETKLVDIQRDFSSECAFNVNQSISLVQTDSPNMMEHSRATVELDPKTHSLNLSISTFQEAEGGIAPGYTSAKSVWCKLVSAEKLAQLRGCKQPVAWHSCQLLNRYALEVASQFISPSIFKRYKDHGEPLQFGDDMLTSSGPAWMQSSITYRQSGENTIVSSPRLYTSVNSFIFPGHLYCKLMSPARAFEYIAHGSLKKWVISRRNDSDRGFSTRGRPLLLI